MLEIFCFGCVFGFGFLLGHVKGSMDEEERQRKIRKKIYTIKEEK